jgi:hypothetical protein
MRQIKEFFKEDKKKMSPFFLEGDKKFVRKPIEQIYGKEDY